MKHRLQRPRIRSADAVLVHSRVKAAAAQLGLRCGLLAVLVAVLALLVGYKRLRDDEVAIRHITSRLPAGTRLLSATTIGRLLRQLDALELITYRPARGRGHTAHLAIHPRFCEQVSELARDVQGRVVIADPSPNPTSQSDSGHGLGPTPKPGPESGPAAHNDTGNVEFPAPSLLIERSPRKDHPLPPMPDGAVEDWGQLRPSEVPVPQNAVAKVLAAIPQCYRTMPGPVRWHLGAAIQVQLGRGWREDQVIDILAAPLPDVVSKPLVLARWRFAQNMPGAGPRLRPLQRAWERAHDAAERTSWARRQNHDYAEIVADVGTQTAHRMAETARRITATTPGGHAYPVTAEQHHSIEQAATITAARMARRDHPGQPLTTAASTWLAAHDPTRPPSEAICAPDRELSIADLIVTAAAGRCVRCRSLGAVTREDLPIPAPVCEDCWLEITEEDSALSDCSPGTRAAARDIEAYGGREAC
jgi:hypothetical protein